MVEVELHHGRQHLHHVDNLQDVGHHQQPQSRYRAKFLDLPIAIQPAQVS